LVQQRNADRQAAIALEERENAEQQTAIAEEQRGNADRQAAIAEDERENADRQAAIAEEQRQNAEQHANETRAGELAGLASLAIDEDPDRAILLGLAAQELMSEPSAVLLSALHRAAQSARLTSSIPGVVNFSMDQSPDGSLLVADRLDRHGFKVIDAASGRTVADVTTKYPISDYGLAFDSTGSTVAVAYANSPDESVPLSSSSTPGPVSSSVRSPVPRGIIAARSSTTRPVAGWPISAKAMRHSCGTWPHAELRDRSARSSASSSWATARRSSSGGTTRT
jgi:multidrug efflux pump subunit AcrA (membrane-fusion protein)